jgi:Mrp family chromosome partitioning ATPase
MKMVDSAPDLVQRAAAQLENFSLRTQHITARQRAVTVSPAKLAARGIVLPDTVYSRTVEEFRAVKRGVLNTAAQECGSAFAERSRIVLVTSANPGEGKTFTAINLALSLACEKDISPLLMDCDAYRQSLLEYLGISADRGWIDIISGEDVLPGDVILSTSVPNLEILPAGKVRPHIPELMSSRSASRLFSELLLQNPNRIIVLDSLSCLTSTEPSILAALAGQTVFVVASYETSSDDITSALRQVETCHSVSLVLNKAEKLLTGHGLANMSEVAHSH